MTSSLYSASANGYHSTSNELSCHIVPLNYGIVQGLEIGLGLSEVKCYPTVGITVSFTVKVMVTVQVVLTIGFEEGYDQKYDAM